MTDLDGIFELTDSVLPKGADKVVFFCEVEERAYEILYYAFFPDGTRKQCYELAEEGSIDGALLDERFGRIADFIRKSDCFEKCSRNVITLTMKGTDERVGWETFGKEIGLYQIKKEWKSRYE